MSRANEMCELAFRGDRPLGSQVTVPFSALIKDPSGSLKLVNGFYAGNNIYKFRFLPETAGVYTYKTQGVIQEEGIVSIDEALEGSHGMIQADGTHLTYKDGTPFHGFGTTVYALPNQSEELIKETMDTLAKSPFNKIRMCIFPKHYDYNHNEPEHFAFHFKEGKEGTAFNPYDPKLGELITTPVNDLWNVHKPVHAFWDALESRIEMLGKLGIQVDLILFHPYDRWGFANMPKEDNLVYLDYCMRRLSAYPNIWWSLSNEYDLCYSKTAEDWDSFGEYIAANDPYHHLLGNHNCFEIYDASKPYITHTSVQKRLVSRTPEFLAKWNKPVCIDECAYEGNLIHAWGNISAKEMTRRFWITTVTGGHCTHGETYLDPDLAYSEDAVVWWSRGGKLIGESPARIAFLRSITEEMNGHIDPVIFGLRSLLNHSEAEIEEIADHTEGSFAGFIRSIANMSELERARHADAEPEYCGHVGDKYILYYYDEQCPARKMVNLPAGHTYTIEAIDTWNMTRTVIAENAQGTGPQGEYEIRLPLPAREGMAVLCSEQ